MTRKVAAGVQMARFLVTGCCCCVACEFPEYDLNPPARASGGEAGETSHSNGAAAGEASSNNGGAAGEIDEPIGGAAGAGGLAGTGTGGSAPTAILTSCEAIKLRSPEVPSGSQVIDADGEGSESPFAVYCDMVTDGGGWTLLSSMAEQSALDASGDPNENGYEKAGVSRAYSALPIGMDFRLDGSDTPIVGEAQDVTTIVHGVSEALRGAALRSALTRSTSTYLASPTSRVVTSWFNGRTCDTWPDFGGAVCSTEVLVFQDPSGCTGELLALGVDASFFVPHPQCDGWPQHPGTNFPKAFRFWTR